MLYTGTFTGVLLHGLRNVVYAAASYSFGALGNRFGRIKMLAFRYALAVLMVIGFIPSPPNTVIYGLLFTVAGTYIAAEVALESVVSGQMVEEQRRSPGFDSLAAVNGVGDLISSFAVGILWSVYGFAAGSTFATVAGAAGVLALIRGNKSAEYSSSHNQGT